MSSFLSYSVLSLLPFLIFSLLSLTPTPVTAQNTISLYQPIAHAASAILSDGGLYLYGGTAKFEVDPNAPNTGSSRFLRVDLTQSFNTTAPPWTGLPGYLVFTMIDAVPSGNGKQFILGGNRDNNGALSYIYDVASAQWITAPDLPGVNMANYKRGNVGVALNKDTGLVYIYGGFQVQSFSRELSILDTSNPDPRQMRWTLSLNQTSIPTLYQPYVFYLPTLKKTLVMGGCPTYNGHTGLVGACAPLNIGYLISGGSSEADLSIQSQPLSTGPSTRYHSCRLVLGDGNIFMQGGRDPNRIFADAWILSVSNWTWSPIEINGPAAARTRAGHACQLGPHGQIIIVGGYNKQGNESYYVTPYMAVINTNNWTWNTWYKGAPLNKIWPDTPLPNPTLPDDNGNDTGTLEGLSGGAMAGIGAGVAIGVLGLALGLFFWRRQRLSTNHQNNQMIGSGSSQPSSSIEEKPQYTSNHHNSNTDVNRLAYSDSAQIFPDGSGSRTATLPSTTTHVEYMTGDQHGVSHGSRGTGPLLPSEPVTLTNLTTLPIYSGNLATGTLVLEKGSPMYSSPVISNVKPGSSTHDAALAAALFQAEDKATSRPPKSNPATSPLSSQSHMPLSSPITVHTVHTPETYIPGVKYMATSSPSLPLSKPSSKPPAIPSRIPTIHTPIASSIPTDKSGVRPVLGPQSVPEHEAWVERSSPGVKTHIITPQDLGPDGFYPPLTPSRPHGSHSILVGTPASNLPSTASSFSAITSSLRFTPSSESSPLSAGGGYFGTIDGQKQEDEETHQPTTTQSMPYRDPQMMKDLDDIAKLIESQTLAETKNPQAIVTPLSGIEKKSLKKQENNH
ncbi:hypothetical protein BGX27_002547 [Mortierella sp. AM989]|nr:hypothetical protein BGX27_002547 [Mortierella sp. AM989]